MPSRIRSLILSIPILVGRLSGHLLGEDASGVLLDAAPSPGERELEAPSR